MGGGLLGKSSLTLQHMLGVVVAGYGSKTAIVSGDERLSYADLDKTSNRVANALIKIGIKRGDRVAILLSNSLEYVTTFFGVVKTGATAIPLDPQYRRDELATFFTDCRPSVLITEKTVLEPLESCLHAFRSIEQVVCLSGCGGPYLNLDVASSGCSEARVEDSSTPEEVAVILYTSGPSSSPRGVMLSHKSLVKEAEILSDGYQQTDKDVVMLYALPMYHVFGLVAILLAAVSKGSTVVIVPGTGLSISSFMAAIEREKGTMFLAVPYIFALAVDIAQKEGIKHDLSSLRLVSSSADFLPANLVKRFKELYGFEILDCFALTEATCHVTCPPINGAGKAGSVGQPLPGWEVRIEDNEGRVLLRGQTGEIVLKGPIMSGYFRNPKATSETIKDGWLHTGDIGKLDKEDYLYILGRKKNIIIVKGQNIWPEDVEAVLHRHPAIADAVVIGIPDEMRGEVVGAVVTIKPGMNVTEAEIKHLCLERLASYKVPKQIYFVDSLPNTKDGKIDTEAVRRNLKISSTFLHG